MYWTEDALKKACRDCLRQQQELRAPSTRWLSKMVVWFTKTTVQIRMRRVIRENHTKRGHRHSVHQAEVEEIHINDLPYPILAHILHCLDLIGQLRIQRVCVLWKLLLEQSTASQRHMILDFPLLAAGKPVHEKSGDSAFRLNVERHYYTYQLVALLDRHLGLTNMDTVALVATAGHTGYNSRKACHAQMRDIRHIFQAKDLRLPLIIIKDSGDRPEAALMHMTVMTAETDGYRCRVLSQWMGVCQQLLLINYTTSLPTGLHSLLDLLFGPDASKTTWEDGGDVAARWMERDTLTITIPFLRFHCTETGKEQRGRFIAAVNDHCPAVSQGITAKVTKMLARWVQTLVYPDQWTGICQFLILFSSVDPDGRPQRWDDVDLRQLDVTVLSRLAMHMLDEFFQDWLEPMHVDGGKPFTCLQLSKKY
ncbi:uncharacterized protein LOC129600219 [Paramacrobiotus metropolitanus]|uniref:uncharacterized protein LOC129600219 n=1 Tax=Paramacrobiotus metropolitanus TaxID=2943436 RepID=UPI002445F301|nr:uncharacterized protein LOC129600219 [Paramacrobiotus metropolitanus]